MVSSPGLTGRSSNHRPRILDCIEIGCFRFRQFNAEVGQARLRVKPGNDMLGQPKRHDACRDKRPTASCPATPDKIEPKHYRCWHEADGNSHRLDRETQAPTPALWSGLTGR